MRNWLDVDGLALESRRVGRAPGSRQAAVAWHAHTVRHPNRPVDAEPDKPAVVEMLHQVCLATAVPTAARGRPLWRRFDELASSATSTSLTIRRSWAPASAGNANLLAAQRLSRIARPSLSFSAFLPS